MSMFPAYAVGDIDQLSIHNYRALLIHGAEIKAEERRSRIVDMAFAVRLGMADAESYDASIRRLTGEPEIDTSNQPVTIGDKLFTDSYVQAGLVKTEAILSNLEKGKEEGA
jgi:hypothetical protein